MHGNAPAGTDDVALAAALRKVDETITGVEFWPFGNQPQGGLPALDPAEDDGLVRLIAAIAAAARAAQQVKPMTDEEATVGGPSELQARKRAVDGAATSAGERILDAAVAAIEVRAGEGARDDSPGAVLGQSFGLSRGSDQPHHAVIDYVDGTGLAARGLPNALSLGALGTNIPLVPDLKVFAVLGMRADVSDVDLLNSPADAAATFIRRLQARVIGQPKVRVLTHTSDEGPQHSWYRYLESLDVDVVIPNPIAVEPPYILSLAIEDDPHIDCMVGVMGLVELVYAAMLLDLLAPGHAFAFRIVGQTAAKDLMSEPPQAYELSDGDLAVAAQGHLSPQVTYSSDDFVHGGSTSGAALFAVTEAPLLGLPAARPESVAGLVVLPNAIQGLTIHYRVDTD